MAEHVCPWWLAYTFDNPLRQWLHDPARILGPYLRPGMTVLDVGCGMGYFAIAMARLVGEKGRVIAADLQPEMLATVGRRSRKAGMRRRISLHRSRPERLGLDGLKTDFALNFWMVHEVPDPLGFFREIYDCLEDGGILFVAEPRLHVSQRRFGEIVLAAQAAGFVSMARPPVRFSRSCVFSKTGR